MCHLFFNCRVARFLWNALFITFNIQPPKDNIHLFGTWLWSFSPSLRNHITVGLAAVCWASWLKRNDTVFKKKKNTNSFLQVIFRGTFWIRHWSQLSKEEERAVLKKGCRRSEVMLLEVFGRMRSRLQRSL